MIPAFPSISIYVLSRISDSAPPTTFFGLPRFLGGTEPSVGSVGLLTFSFGTLGAFLGVLLSAWVLLSLSDFSDVSNGTGRGISVGITKLQNNLEKIRYELV